MQFHAARDSSWKPKDSPSDTSPPQGPVSWVQAFTASETQWFRNTGRRGVNSWSKITLHIFLNININ